jgi:hypothetical protein
VGYLFVSSNLLLDLVFGCIPTATFCVAELLEFVSRLDDVKPLEGVGDEACLNYPTRPLTVGIPYALEGWVEGTN